MRERWWADGYELTDGVFRDIRTRAGMLVAPHGRGDAVFVTGRHGALSTARRYYGVAPLHLSCWLADTSPAAVQAGYEVLLRALAPAHRLPTLTRLLGDGTTRTCRARLADDLTPAYIGQVAMSIDVVLEIPGAFWYDVADTTDTSTVGAAALGSVVPLLSKAKASAPMTSLRYVITGPVQNPQITVVSDPEVQDTVLWSGYVAMGQTITIDSGAGTISGTGNLNPALTSLSYTGDRFLDVPPAMPLDPCPVVRFDGTGGGPTTQLAVVGRTAHLI